MNEEDRPVSTHSTQGCPEDSRANWRLPDYKPAITDRPRTAGWSAEKRGPEKWGIESKKRIFDEQ